MAEAQAHPSYCLCLQALLKVVRALELLLLLVVGVHLEHP
jgi:hypothetical protein